MSNCLNYFVILLALPEKTHCKSPSNFCSANFNNGKIIKIMKMLFLLCIYLFLLLNPQDAAAQSQVSKILVDNFEKPGKVNTIGGDFGAFSDSKSLGSCYLFFIENKAKDKLGDSKYSLYVQWDASKEGAYAGYWTDLKHLNLEEFNYISFYVKGTKGGEKFKIGLRGKINAAYETKILINEVLSKGATTEWQKVVIPLKYFSAVQDWKDITIFSINFEHTFGSDKGAILIDNITFEK